MTVGHMLTTMSAAEFEDWRAFFNWEAQEEKDTEAKRANQGKAAQIRQRAKGAPR